MEEVIETIVDVDVKGVGPNLLLIVGVDTEKRLPQTSGEDRRARQVAPTLQEDGPNSPQLPAGSSGQCYTTMGAGKKATLQA